MARAKIPVIVVGGPTASGKSALALRLARDFGGEIVNCDSLQLYRGMDIGTAKPSADERASAPHHLFDILDPHEVFNAGEYAERARACIREIGRRSRVPILVGGTGFYLRSLLEGLTAGPGRDEALRTRLAEGERRRPGFLARLLRRLDPAAAKRIHRNDLNKLTRAVEICLRAGESASELFAGRGKDRFEEATALKLVLNPPRDELKARIELRTRRMLEAGLVEEVEELRRRGVPEAAKAFEAIGYRQALAVLAGRMTRAEALQAVTIATRQYAKRQVTWFRREAGVRWLAGFGEDAGIQADAVRICKDFLEKFTVPPAAK